MEAGEEAGEEQDSSEQVQDAQGGEDCSTRLWGGEVEVELVDIEQTEAFRRVTLTVFVVAN